MVNDMTKKDLFLALENVHDDTEIWIHIDDDHKDVIKDINFLELHETTTKDLIDGYIAITSYPAI